MSCQQLAWSRRREAVGRPRRTIRQHGPYLRNWSRKSVRTYWQGLNAFQMALDELEDSNLTSATVASRRVLTKAHLDTFVIGLRQGGLAVGGCNMYIRTVDGFLSLAT